MSALDIVLGGGLVLIGQFGSQIYTQRTEDARERRRLKREERDRQVAALVALERAVGEVLIATELQSRDPNEEAILDYERSIRALPAAIAGVNDRHLRGELYGVVLATSRSGREATTDATVDYLRLMDMATDAIERVTESPAPEPSGWLARVLRLGGGG